MKRIKATHSNNDRIICEINVTAKRHDFFYQPAKSSQKYYLFTAKRFSPSVGKLFTNKGILICSNSCGQVFSITLGELYRLNDYHHNCVLDKLMCHITTVVNDVIRYEMEGVAVFEAKNGKEFGEQQDSNRVA